MKCSKCLYNKFMRSKRPITKASVAVVGESPSPMDVRDGTVLESRGGDVVRNTLAKVGINAHDIYYTTALKCAVPKKSGKQIAKTAMENCRDYLYEEINRSGAKLVIALGATAAKMLVGEPNLKIKEVQGLAKKNPKIPNAIVISVVHPAMILRAPGEYKSFLRAFEYAANLYNGTDEILDPGVTEYRVCRTAEDVEEAREFLSKQGRLGCDIETTQLSPYSIPKQGAAGETLVIGIAYAKNKVIGFAKSAIPYMQPIFDLPNEFVWHGGKFDAFFAKVADGLDLRIDHDLMLVSYCLNETSGNHDLEQVAMRTIGVDAYKDEANVWIRSKEGFGAAPEEVQLTRVCKDADYTLQSFEKMYPQILADDNLSRLYHERLIPAAKVYAKIQDNGLRLDRNELAKLTTKYEREMAEIIKEIEKATENCWDPERYKYDTGAKTAGEKFKPTSPKQVSWLVFDALKLKPRIRKKRSTSVDVLESIENPPEVIQLILKYRSVVKEYGTYVKGFEQRMDENDRVHSNFSLHVTATGRRSSSDPNVQNIPSRRLDIKRAFIPDPGKVLVEVDYSAAESRVLAIVSKDENYLNLFLEGRDPHGELAAQLYGPNYTKNDRTRAKAVNFGVPYGRSAYTIAQEHGMSVSEAQSLIDAWAARYPSAWAYLEECAQLAREGKAIVSPMGRYKRPGLITPDTIDGIMNEYKNYTIQSTVGEFTLLSAVELDKLLDPKECIIVNEIHDSLLFEMVDDKDIIKRNCSVILDVMATVPERYLGWTLPFIGDVEVGYNWADMVPLDEFIK